MLSILVMSTHTHEKRGGHLDSSLFLISPSFLTSFYSLCFSVSFLSDHSLPSASLPVPAPPTTGPREIILSENLNSSPSASTPSVTRKFPVVSRINLNLVVHIFCIYLTSSRHPSSSHPPVVPNSLSFLRCRVVSHTSGGFWLFLLS